MTIKMEKRVKWHWCELCNCACIKCEICNNISCSGGGCDICYDEFEEAIRLVNEGKVPYSSDMEIIPDAMKKLLGK